MCSLFLYFAWCYVQYLILGEIFFVLLVLSLEAAVNITGLLWLYVFLQGSVAYVATRWLSLYNTDCLQNYKYS